MCITGLPLLVLYRAAPAAAAELTAERAHLRQAGGPKFPLLPLATARVPAKPGRAATRQPARPSCWLLVPPGGTALQGGGTLPPSSRPPLTDNSQTRFVKKRSRIMDSTGRTQGSGPRGPVCWRASAHCHSRSSFYGLGS